ncbi:hypothetical protein HXX02_00115 [Microbulbifer elongatus]|uniref:Uncharacterized protein n=1 Tax=Microbulbifer elongatus TaxID=86173 RepID=A0ABT1NY75_9GAMM|nr:hypothetical protein [Microbulbifer elongatus]MCQ3827839.1 hypothetical protein [Microbulbifer elongatus]
MRFLRGSLRSHFRAKSAQGKLPLPAALALWRREIKKIAVIIFLTLWGSFFLFQKWEHKRLLSDLQEIDENSISAAYIYRQETEEWVDLEAHTALIGALFSTAASDLSIHGGRPVFIEPRIKIRIEANERCYDLELSGQSSSTFKMYIAVGRAVCSEHPEFPVRSGPNGFYSVSLKAFRELLVQLGKQS